MAASASSKFHPIPDALWERIEPVLPSDKVSCHGGRPRLAMRPVVAGILYVLRTGCQWKAMPREFGSGRAIHADFQEWVRRGVFHRLWRLALEEYDDLVSIDWTWQSLDGAMTKAPSQARPRPAVGRRAASLVDQPRATVARPLGKASRQRSGISPSPIRSHRLENRRDNRIGSDFKAESIWSSDLHTINVLNELHQDTQLM